MHFHTPFAETLEHYLLDHYVKEGLCPHPKGEELMREGWHETLCEVAPVNADGEIKSFDLVEFIRLANTKLHLWRQAKCFHEFVRCRGVKDLSMRRAGVMLITISH